MSTSEFLRKALPILKADFAKVTGREFNHFFCPILFADEDVELCEAHIVNQAFENIAGISTVQRKDVDSFYGSRFESDFVDIERLGSINVFDVLRDRTLSRRLRPTIYVDDQPVDWFVSQRRKLDVPDSDVVFGIKVVPGEIPTLKTGRWEVEVRKDLRLPVLVSAIKAAHLSMFRVLGYSYALSAAGHFVGQRILGDFYLSERRSSRRVGVQRAHGYFESFSRMVLPLLHTELDLEGTAIDRRVLVLKGMSGQYWAMVVIVRTGELRHAVLLPTAENLDQLDTFLGFLKNENTSVQAAPLEFCDDHWKTTAETREMIWNKSGTLRTG